MSLIHAFIIGNLIVVGFNMIGMCTRFPPPPIWAYAIGWPCVIAIVYLAGQA